MIYLIAKYTLLFLLASILGFVLGYWWSRRNIVDVSESYEDLRKAAEETDAAEWDRLWARLDALPEPRETDLSPVLDGLSGVRSAIASIPKPDAVNLAPVEHRIESLAGQIAKIPAPVDIAPLGERLKGLEAAVHSIPAPPPQQEVDLRPVRDDLSAIRKQISGLPKVETHEPVNLTPVIRQVDALERRVGSMPQPDKVDLKPIDGRLRKIESDIGKLGKRLARPAPAPQKAKRESKPQQRRTAPPKILSAALYGKKDDLKRITGVGPKLEKLLNKNGVYYFWQVASWSATDIRGIDERLESFKGRISRDNWVSQAKQLKRAPDAADVPGGPA